MTTRRAFVSTVAWAATAPRALAHAAAYAASASPALLVDDEAYWSSVRQAFALDRTLTYLNSAGISPASTAVLEGMVRALRFANSAPVEHMWRGEEPEIEGVRRALAAEFGCDPEEMAITRNASEALETLIFGLPLGAGDEVIVTAHNYDRMLTAWAQRARRDGIVVRTVTFPLPVTSDAVVIEAIREAITDRTRVIEIPHLTNWTGQPLPVPAIVALGRARGVSVIVDGAQTFAHTPVSRDALGCDYYATSLHKWLLAPVGSGFLYVRRERIPAVWPLFAAPEARSADVRKFEEIGTHPAANHNAITAALAFHHSIGGPRKLARLKWLRDRWARAIGAESPRVHIRTPLDDPRSGAIALVEIEGLEAGALARWLWVTHRIVTSAIAFGGVTGVRVTPNVFTTPSEIDRLTDALRTAIRKGIT